MAQEKPIAQNRRPRPVGHGFPDSASMTPKEARGILRRHIFLIICLTILGVGAGGTGWYLLQKYVPRYTATTYIKVLPPVETDPMEIVAPQTQKDIIYGYRQSIANLKKQQSSLEALLESEEVKKTQWFERRDRSIRKAVKYLNRYLSAYAHRPLSWNQLRSEIAAGRPVIVWIVGSVINGIPVYYKASDGHVTVVAPYEHTVIVTGYSESSIYYLNGGYIYSKSIEQFLDSWSVMGNMAITSIP